MVARLNKQGLLTSLIVTKYFIFNDCNKCEKFKLFIIIVLMSKLITKIKQLSIYQKTVIVSIVIFGISLTQDAVTVYDYDREEPLHSLIFFIGGAFAILGGGPAEWIIWMANPLYILSIYLLLKNDGFAKKTSFIAALLGILFFLFSNSQGVLTNENGNYAPVTVYKLGYILWLISLLLVCILTFIHFSKLKKSERNV